jgi:hypothetical protein
MSDTATTQDAVRHAIGGNAKAFNDTVKDLLMNKVRDAVDLKKIEVSSKFMSDDDSEMEDSVNEPEGETNVEDSEV